MGTIVLLKDLLDQKARKEEEIVRYRKHLEALQVKLSYLQKEIALTETIIRMVQKEQIVEIKSV